MEKKISVKTLYLLLVISIGLIGLGIGSTYALFTAGAEISSPIVLGSNLSYNSNLIETVSVTVPAGNTINNKLNITNNTGDKLNYVTWYTNKGLDIELGVSDGTPTGSLAAGGTTSVVVNIRNNTNESVTVVLGISSSVSSVVLGSGMTIIPSTELSETVLQGAASYIYNLYMSNEHTLVTTANSGNSYYRAESAHLINDGYNSLGYKTNSESSGNIRYYGNNPDNYVYFNCDDYSNQTDDTCEKWRIIGVFDGKVKIVRDTAIGTYSWDYNADGTYDNDWRTATLKTLLNDGYYNNKDGVTHYNRVKDASTSTYGPSLVTVNFATYGIGIKNDKTRDLISNHVWGLAKASGGLDIYTNTAYELERGAHKNSGDLITWTGKIGLMYGTDYTYASDLSVCDVTLVNYHDTNCTENNWLYSGEHVWLLPSHSSNTGYAWYINGYSGSGLGKIFLGGYVDRVYSIYPTLYLNSDVDIIEGDGSSDSPYRLIAGNEVVEHVVSGIPPFNIYANEEDLVNYKIYGNSVQNGTPTPESPVEIESVGDKTRNLLDISNAIGKEATIDGAKIWIEEDGSINGSGTPTGYIAVTEYVETKLSGEVTFSISGNYSNLACLMRFYDSSNNILHTFTISSLTPSITINMDDYPTYDRLYLEMKRNLNNAEMSGKAYLQIEEGSAATEYEPYGYKIPIKVKNGVEEVVTNIYLDEPLRKVGDYADYIDFENGKVVRKIKEITLDGTQDWKGAVFGEHTLYYLLLSDMMSGTRQNFFSNGFATNIIYGSTNQLDNSITFGYSNQYIYVRYDGISNVTDFKTYLSNNNNFKITYVLSKEVEETIELPNIPTLKGTTIIEVDTEVQPSNMEFVYYG